MMSELLPVIINGVVCGNFEHSEELMRLVDGAFKPKSPLKNTWKRGNTDPSSRKATKEPNRKHRADNHDSSKLLNAPDSAKFERKSMKIDFDSVMNHLRENRGRALNEPPLQSIRPTKSKVLAGRRVASKLSMPSPSVGDVRSNRTTKSHSSLPNNVEPTRLRTAVKRLPTPNNSSISKSAKGFHSDPKSESRHTFSRLREQKSISQINGRIPENKYEDVEIVKAARAAILQQRRENEKAIPGTSKRMSTSRSTSASGSRLSSSEEQLTKDEAVDRILSATLGVS